MVGDSAAGWHMSLGPYGTTGLDGMVIFFVAGLIVLTAVLIAVALSPRKTPRPALVWAQSGRSPAAKPAASGGVKLRLAAAAPVPRRKELVVLRNGYRRLGAHAAHPRHPAPGLSKFVARRQRRRP